MESEYLYYLIQHPQEYHREDNRSKRIDDMVFIKAERPIQGQEAQRLMAKSGGMPE